MKTIIQILYFTFLAQILLSQGSFAPAAGQFGSTAIHKDSAIFVAWSDRCTINRGYQQINDTAMGLAAVGDSSESFGIADGATVSLGDGGEATIFLNQSLFNGPGADFAVFENGFSSTFLELAFVEVSSNGIDFFRFPAVSETQIGTQIGSFGSLDASEINNLAGKYHVYFGTPFDLDDLPDTNALNKFAISHLKIIDVVGNIAEPFSSRDSRGNVINDPWPTPFGSSGFDLDAVGLIHVNGINSIKEEDISLTLFPNPAENWVTVSTDLRVKYIQLVDVQGRLYEFQNQNRIDVSNLIPGVYFVKITTNTHVYVKKLVKK